MRSESGRRGGRSPAGRRWRARIGPGAGPRVGPERPGWGRASLGPGVRKAGLGGGDPETAGRSDGSLHSGAVSRGGASGVRPPARCLPEGVCVLFAPDEISPSCLNFSTSVLLEILFPRQCKRTFSPASNRSLRKRSIDRIMFFSHPPEVKATHLGINHASVF